MNAPGSRRLSRRETGQAAVDGGAEQRRLEATVARLRLELARLRGEVDDDVVPTGAEATTAGEEEDGDGEGGAEAAAEAEARATRAEQRVRLLAEELGAERRTLDQVRSRLSALEEVDARRQAELVGSEEQRERLGAAEASLAEERQARLMLETLRDGLEKAMEEQRLRHEREIADVQEAAEERRTEQTLGHVRELERGRAELEAVRGECAALAARLEEEEQARSRAETRVQQLDREVDELRNWISAAESRRRGLFRRTAMPPPPGRIQPGP